MRWSGSGITKQSWSFARKALEAEGNDLEHGPFRGVYRRSATLERGEQRQVRDRGVATSRSRHCKHCGYRFNYDVNTARSRMRNRDCRLTRGPLRLCKNEGNGDLPSSDARHG